jgi:lipopolysaccharide/colanic/teichoic acid biosynthesis glycosyltransferase
MASRVAHSVDIGVNRSSQMSFTDVAIPRNYLKFRRISELLLIILFLPLILLAGLLIAYLVALESKGSVLFIQLRPGRGGKVFKMVKFRTMYQHSSQERLAVEDDQRLTAIGAKLRKYRLDEIPQFWNVLKGDMSLIGPRPVPYNFYKIYLEKLPGYDARHTIRPGITGLAQVRLGYTNTLEGEQKKLQYDLLYINNISFRMDMSIIWRTVCNMAGGKK